MSELGKHFVELKNQPSSSEVEFMMRVAKAMSLEFTGNYSDDTYPIFVNKETGIEFEFISNTERVCLEMINL